MRLFLYVLLLSSVFTLVSLVCQLWYSYRKDIAEIENSFQFIETSYIPSVINSLYEVNDEQLKLLIAGIIKIQDIAYVEILEKSGQKEYSLKQGDPGTKNNMVKTFDLTHATSYQSSLNLGTMTVVASFKGVYQRLWNNARVIFISSAIQIFLLGFFIFIVIQYLITRHLSEIARHTEAITMETLDSPLMLRRIDSNSESIDELDQVVNSINDLKQRLLRDIREREAAEVARRKSEEKFRLLFQASVDGILMADVESKSIVEANESACRLFGYSKQELLTLTVSDIHPEESLPNVLSEFKAQAEGKKSLASDIPCLRKDQTIFYADFNTNKINIDGKEINFGIVRDVTQRMHAESSLKVALGEAQLREKEISALLEASQIIPQSKTFEMAARGIFDICTHLIGAKSGYVALLSEDGCENEVLFLEAGGLPCDVNPELPMPIRGLRGEAYKTMQVAYDNDFASSQWADFMPKGHVLLENVLFAPLNVNERAVGLIGIANKPGGFTEQDAKIAMAFGDLAAVALTYVTYQEKLRDSEEKYRSIMEAMDDATAICSSDYRVEYMNPAMVKRVGRDCTGDMCFNSIHGLDAPCSWCDHQRVMNGGMTKLEITSPLDNKDYHVSSSPIFHPDGTVSKLTVFHDITEIKSMETRLRQAQKMEAIGNLAGGIAHDFNNILFPIVGMSEMMMEDLPESSPEKQYAQEIFKAGQRGGDLVKQILAFSRQTDHKMIPVKIQSVLKEALKLCRSSIPSDIKINQRIQEDCGLVNADSTQFHQVVMNLVTNAYHAVEKNSGEISVSFKELVLGPGDLSDSLLEPGPYALLTVSDTGSGIDPIVKDKIFEPYFTTKAQGKGTGLGLATVYGIIREHHGDIKVYSELGKGSTFNVYLPLVDKSLRLDGMNEKSAIGTGSERILLVDDEQVIVNLEKTILERLGYQVDSFTSSVDALVSFRSDPDAYDIVITDMTMPQMTGDLFSKELREISADIPIIVCTGFSERISKDMLQSLKIDGLLMKPVIKSDLARMVRDTIDAQKISE